VARLIAATSKLVSLKRTGPSTVIALHLFAYQRSAGGNTLKNGAPGNFA
jgi:hypothetical protein